MQHYIYKSKLWSTAKFQSVGSRDVQKWILEVADHIISKIRSDPAVARDWDVRRMVTLCVALGDDQLIGLFPTTLSDMMVKDFGTVGPGNRDFRWTARQKMITLLQVDESKVQEEALAARPRKVSS